jgi:FPC/CPF motif-containing protein YcgG
MPENLCAESAHFAVVRNRNLAGAKFVATSAALFQSCSDIHESRQSMAATPPDFYLPFQTRANFSGKGKVHAL